MGGILTGVIWEWVGNLAGHVMAPFRVDMGTRLGS